MQTTTTTSAAPQTVIAQDVDQSRLRVRYLSDSEIESLIYEVRETALGNGAWAHEATHAGDVANAYQYPASTTGCVVVSDPDGNVTVWLCRLPANKVTLSGVIARCLEDDARPLYDDRYGAEARRDAELAVQHYHREALARG